MINLSEVQTYAPKGLNKKETEEATKKLAKRIGELQERLYAEREKSLLIILQGMDASGKDGTTKAILRYCLPTYVRVATFKKPTEEERAHDFLWRIHKQTPERGFVTVFNRSHYEDVLIQRVHGWISEERAQLRLEAINAFENLLNFDNQTVILKFFLHIGFNEQEKELRARTEKREKHWKHNASDWSERKHWAAYMKAYEDVLEKSAIKWHIIPADDEWYRNYLVCQKVCEVLENLNPQYPPLSME